MPTVPCSGAQNCLDVESPVSNLSSEGPDVAKCFRYSFGPQSQAVCEFDLSLCSAFAAVGADVGILCDPLFGPPGGPNPPPPVIYSSSAQSCTVDCGGFSETYSVAPGTFVALSQADANSAAANFACELAALQCTGPVTTFTNTPQSCTGTCANGDSITYTTPAGFFTALSQSEANVNAFLFACEVAALLCASAPPVGTFPGAGTERQDPTNPLYGNFEQSCTSVCPDGSIYSHTIAAGTYTSESRAAANAIANSAACVLANSFRFCLSELPATACVGEFFFETLQADANFTTTFSLVSGALPDGLVLTSQGFIQGVPSAPGSFTFTIRATNPENGNSTQRAYTMNAIEITPDTLPDGEPNTPYAEALSAAGTVGSETWAITSGELPPGLVFNPNSAVLSGTPTMEGTYPFTVSVTDQSGTCDKSYSIAIESSEIWKSLVWTTDIVGIVAAGTFNENTFSGLSIKAFGGGDTARALGSGTMTYTGPAINSRFTLNGICTDGPPDGVAVIIYSIRYFDGFVFQYLVDSSTPYGPVNVDIPFVLPALAGVVIEVDILFLSDLPFGGVGTPSCSGSGSITTDP